VKALYFDRATARALAAQALGKVRKDLAFGRLSPVSYGEVPIPELPGPEWVKVANLECGLCGTDVHLMFMDIDPRSFAAAIPTLPRTFLGHECWGRVVGAGESARTGRDGPSGGFCPGERVALRISWPSCVQMGIDPPCRQCRAGAYMLCENTGRLASQATAAASAPDSPEPRRQGKGRRSRNGGRRRRAEAAPEPAVADTSTMGAVAAVSGDGSWLSGDLGGGFSPIMVAHAEQLFRIPDAVPNERAVLLEPTAVAVHAALRRLPQPGDHVLVIGGGSIGLLLMAVLRHYAPDIELHCVVRHEMQAALAEWLGAIVHRPGAGLARDLARASGACYVHAPFSNEALLGGFDVVFDAVGSGETLRDALRWVRARGAVVLLGAELRSGRFDYTPLWHQEIDLLGVDGHATEADGRSSFDHAAQLLADPGFPVEGLVTHRFPMDAWQDAVRAFLDKEKSGAVKIVLEHLEARGTKRRT